MSAFNPSRDAMNERFGDQHYQPNPGGFYELHRSEYQQYRFPIMYPGKLIKVLFGGVWRLYPWKYKIVYMKRDPEEIRQSYEAFFNQKAPPNLRNYDQINEDTLAYINIRSDMDVDVFRYREVVEKPKDYFALLKKHGWPIDVGKAVAVIKTDLCRFRRENLTVGI